VSNAIKFTHHGGVTITVRRLEDVSKGIVLSIAVRDTGIGIAVEAQARLFAPFAQADASVSRRYGGTGLGLSIVKSLVNTMGGRLHLESNPGQGSKFTVVLEFGVADAVAEKIPMSCPPAMREQTLNGVRILVVDDSDINLDVTKRILETDGALASTANNGLVAVEILRAQPMDFDVVLMDVQMPVLDGHEATQIIRVDLGLVDLPIIALTADALSSERQRAIASGMDDLIIKPVDRQTLAGSIGRHVEISALKASTPLDSNEAKPLTSAGSHWPQIQGIDSVEARARLCDDYGLFISNVKRLLDEFSDLAIPITALDAANLGAHCARLHKLTGSASLLAAKPIQKLAADARAALVSGNSLHAQELLSVLAVELNILRQSAAEVLEIAAI
jgi:CheY-like chemotaxis protein